MKKHFFILLLLTILICGFFVIAQNGQAYTQKDQAGFIQQTNEKTGLTQADFAGIIATVINVILGVVGALFVALIVYGGVDWIISGGNPEKVGKAKKIITRAILGLLIVASAYTISYFISSAFEQSSGSTTSSTTQ
jgi:hypothetical protein